jgi:hypothetical protein
MTSDRCVTGCFVISSVLYWLAGRAFALMVLRGGGEGLKDVELLVLWHGVAVFRRHAK